MTIPPNSASSKAGRLALLLLGGLLLLALSSVTREASAQKPAASGPVITLAEAFRMAQKANEDLLINNEMLVQARLARNRAWAALLPRLTARGSFTHNDKEVDRQGTIIQRQDVFAGSLTFTLSLLDPASIPGVIRAHRSANAADHEARWNEGELLFEVARSYYAALTAEQMMNASHRALDTATEHLEAIRELVAAGRAVALDETRFALQVVEATENLTRSRNTYESSVDYLSYLLVAEGPFRLTPPVPPSLPPNVEPGKADQTRQDLMAIRTRVSAAEAAVLQSWLTYLPVLGLAATAEGTQNTGWTNDHYSWRVMLTLEWVLVDAGLRWATQKERQSQLRVTQAQQRQAQRRVLKEQRDVIRNHATAAAVRESSQTRLTLARQTQDMVLARFKAGMATSLELTDADDTLARAESILAASELELSVTTLAVLRAFGYAPPGKESSHE